MRILIYDSGKGGLSVYQLLEKWIEEEKLQFQVSLSYFGDTQNYPYGTKSDEELQKIVHSNLSNFQKEGYDFVGVACNTASGVIEQNESSLGDAINCVSTILQPTFAKISQLSPDHLYIIGSEYTISHHLYGKKTQQNSSPIQIIEHAEQDLVNAIEHDEAEEISRGISQVISQVPENWHLLLACTHFSLVRDQFDAEIKKQGKTIELIDPAEELAREIRLKIRDINKQTPNSKQIEKLNF